MLASLLRAAAGLLREGVLVVRAGALLGVFVGVRLGYFLLGFLENNNVFRTWW